MEKGIKRISNKSKDRVVQYNLLKDFKGNHKGMDKLILSKNNKKSKKKDLLPKILPIKHAKKRSSLHNSK